MSTPDETDQILHWLDQGDAEHLGRARPQVVGGVFLNLLESAARGYPIFDEDGLSSTARVLRHAGYASLDAVATDWLTAAPSAARLDIASVCLQAFWTPSTGPRALDPLLVQVLIDARNAVELNKEADASSLYALARAFEAGLPSPVAERVLHLMRDALKRTHANTGVPIALARAVAKADRKGREPELQSLDQNERATGARTPRRLQRGDRDGAWFRRLSFRSKLLASHVALVLVSGAIALFTLDHWLTTDLVRQLDQRLEEQGKGAIEWAEGGKRHPDRITTRIANIVDAEVTLFDKDGSVLGASTPEARNDIGPEVSAAQAGQVGRASRWRGGQEFHYVAVPGSEGTVLRLAQPLSEINATVGAMRRRFMFTSMLVVLAAIVLGILASRVASRPLRDMTAAATRLAKGEFDIPIPEGEDDEFGVLWRALKSLASQLKARIGDLVAEGARLQRLITVRRDFVANVSHELRTPVTSIQGYAETLLRKDPSPEMRAQFLEVIFRQSQRMGALVEQLLALSELEARGRDDLAREPVVVLSVAKHVAEAALHQAESRKVTIDVQIDETLQVLADPDGVERALLNLVENGVKYGKEGGRVRVTATVETVESARSVESPRSVVTIRVADDGEGIEPMHLPRIFERFYRIDSGRSRQHGGAGLGLAIVKHLVESMDGSIRVESALGKGTTFFVTLPTPRASLPPTAT